MAQRMISSHDAAKGFTLWLAACVAFSWPIRGQDKKQPNAESEALPSAEVILDKYIEVTGGKAAYSRLHTLHLEGGVQVGNSTSKNNITSDYALPANSYEVVSFGLMQVVKGTNGKVAWQKSGPLASIGKGEARLREYGEMDLALLLARFNADATWRDLYSKVETVGVESINGRECYRIELTVKGGLGITGGLQLTKYYDRQSGLLVKTAMNLKVPKTDPPTNAFAAPVPKVPLELGEMAWEFLVGEYRKERDILFPHQTIERINGRVRATTTIEQVDWNASISKDRYGLPDEVQTLLTERKAR
jgi:hypothetical protein